MFKLEAGKVYPKMTDTRSIIRFQDCDPLQHLNNAKYFDYYFNGREDQVAKNYQFKFSEIFKEHNTIWVVYQHQIAYLRPAVVSEWVRIFSRIIHYDTDTILTEYFMTDESGSELKNVLITTSKYVDAKIGRRTSHQPTVMQYLEATAYANIPLESYDFNERIKVLKQETLMLKSSM